MKAMKMQITCIFLCIALFFLITPQLGAQQDIPPEVIKAAQEGLPFFLESISQSNIPKRPSPFLPTPDSAITSLVKSLKVDHGFQENDPLDQAYLGEPFKFCLLTADAILNYTSYNDVNSVLIQTDEWYFPVMIGDNVRTVLIVAKMEGSWKAVFLGRGKLAVELGKIRKQWPLEQGYTPLLVVANRPYRYLFTVPQYDSKNLTIITPSWVIAEGKGVDKDYSKLEYLEDFIAEAKSEIKKTNS